ncbi:MAG: dihydrofolate reductase, partial [Idiomarina sp.]|nr:dihydrofolate reductase [Idiomarina sp.]
MHISLVVAMAADNVIGKDNGMPWHLPSELKHFKAITMGKPIVMGRRTYES